MYVTPRTLRGKKQSKLLQCKCYVMSLVHDDCVMNRVPSTVDNYFTVVITITVDIN